MFVEFNDINIKRKINYVEFTEKDGSGQLDYLELLFKDIGVGYIAYWNNDEIEDKLIIREENFNDGLKLKIEKGIWV